MKKYLYAAVLLVGLGAAGLASASHSWGGYHWARTANTFTLKLGDNVGTNWASYLASASSEWSADPAVLYSGSGLTKVLGTTIVAGTTNSKNCKATAGMVQVCNSTYGNNGWLGIAQIWISGLHITQGAVKLNDTYFNTLTYNKPAWRNLVMCQEIAHTFGLDHQDTTFGNYNLGTCMDYTNAPAGGYIGTFNYGPSNEFPNKHDYEELGIIYAHLDSFTTVSAAKAAGASALAQSGDFTNASEWGKAIGKDSQGRDNEFERDLGNAKVLTHVFWAQ
jgi:hypothetical protein